MFQKGTKYYADWRDATGKRLRKSFTSKRAALQFESEQREQAHPKKQAQGRTSPKYFAPVGSGRAPAPATIKPKLQKRSSGKLVHFRRTN